MADEKKNGHGEGCMCATCNGGIMGKNCGCGCGYRHGGHWTFFLLRALIMIIILMIVFGFGVAVGRMRNNLDYGRGYPMMGYYGSPYPAGVYNSAGGAAAGVGAPMMRINGATTTAAGGVQNY
jgi:hypothetical protein